MKRLACTLMVAGILLVSIAPEAAGQRRRRGEGPWNAMDYGPSLTASIQVAEGNIAYKGVGIRLDQGSGGVSKGNIFMVFDTDLLRWAAGWSGSGFINWRSIAFDESHNTHPSISGEAVFINPVGPGWAKPKSSDFKDPRFLGLDNKPYGPLPRDWAHWKGLYVHGDQVILSYTVGDAGILEMAGLERRTINGYTRNMNIGKSSEDMLVQVISGEQGGAAFFNLGTGRAVRSSGSASETIAVLDQKLMAACLGGGSDLKWIVEGNSLRLAIPASATPVQFKLLIVNEANDGPRKMSILSRMVKPAIDLEPLTHGGPSKWGQVLTTQTIKGRNDGPYAYDDILLPNENPWRSWMRTSGFDWFKDDSKAAVCTWQGDVWIMDGMGENLGDISVARWIQHNGGS